MSLIEGSSPRVALDVATAKVPLTMVEHSLNDIAGASTLMFLSTERNNQPYGCVMVFAFDRDFCLLFFSDPVTEHVHNLHRNEKVAGEIARTSQTWEFPRRGIQFMGTARPLTTAEYRHAIDLYMARFPGFERHSIDPASGHESPVKVRPFIVRPTYLKILDETIFGRETWVEVQLPAKCHEFPGAQA